MDPSPAPPEELDAVARVSGGPADVGDVELEVVYEHAVASATSGIWRCSSGSWSVVAKVLRHGAGGSPAWQSGRDPDHWYYWRREAEAFASGVLGRLAAPLRAPRCLGVFERGDGSAAVWMEDLAGTPSAADWNLERYRLAAFHLGRAQGVLALSNHLPEAGWLARNWLRRYVERRGQTAVAQIEDAPVWDHGLVRDLLPAGTRHECRAIWESRHVLLDLVEAMPETLTHSDLHPGNLFGTTEETVLIDWGFLGRGRLGEDPGNLGFDAVLDFFVPPGRLPELRATLLDGYLAGLEQARWPGDPEDAARAVSAVGAVKFFWVPAAMAAAAASGSPTLNRRPLEEAFRLWAPIVPEIFSACRAALD